MKTLLPALLVAALAGMLLVGDTMGSASASSNRPGVVPVGPPIEPPGARNMNPELRELRRVERAFTRFIDDNNLDEIMPNSVSTSDLHLTQLWTDTSVTPPEPLFLTQKYIRQQPTKCQYLWSSTGAIVEITCPD